MNKNSHKNTISLLFLTSLVLLIFTGLLSYIQYYQLTQINSGLILSYRTLRAANQSLISIDEASLRVSEFLLNRKLETLQKIPQTLNAADVNRQALGYFIKDDIKQTQLAGKLRPLFEEKISMLTQVVKEGSKGNIQQALQIAADRNKTSLSENITQLIIEIKQEEMKQLNQGNEKLLSIQKRSKLFIPVLGVLSGLFFLFGLFGLDIYFKKY